MSGLAQRWCRRPSRSRRWWYFPRLAASLMLRSIPTSSQQAGHRGNWQHIRKWAKAHRLSLRPSTLPGHREFPQKDPDQQAPRGSGFPLAGGGCQTRCPTPVRPSNGLRRTRRGSGDTNRRQCQAPRRPCGRHPELVIREERGYRAEPRQEDRTQFPACGSDASAGQTADRP